MRKIIGRQLAKLGLKAYALKVYFFQLYICNEIIRKYRAFIVPILIKKRARNGLYAINLNSDWLGLGARIVKTLEILKFCEEHNLTPLVRFSYRERDDKKNSYFERLFKYKNSSIDYDSVTFTNVRYVEELQRQGVQLIDCQVYTPHLESLGARMIPRKLFVELIGKLQ